MGKGSTLTYLHDSLHLLLEVRGVGGGGKGAPLCCAGLPSTLRQAPLPQRAVQFVHADVSVVVRVELLEELAKAVEFGGRQHGCHHA